jgi:hypothetical protein
MQAGQDETGYFIKIAVAWVNVNGETSAVRGGRSKNSTPPAFFKKTT